MTALRTPAAAVAWALAQPRWEHAMCLEFVWRCYAPDDSISSALSAYGFPPPIGRAIDGWNGSPLKHADRSPQLGAPIYYSAASSGATAGDGHVAIYVGNGMIRSSDAGGYGINATVPLDWPERAWGRRLLGWTGDILGHDLRLGTAPVGTGPAAPIPTQPTEEEDMEKTRGAQYMGTDKVRRFIIFNAGSGFFAEHSGADGAYNNPLAKEWETGSWPTITAKHADVIRQACADVRAGK